MAMLPPAKRRRTTYRISGFIESRRLLRMELSVGHTAKPAGIAEPNGQHSVTVAEARFGSVSSVPGELNACAGR